MADTVSGVGGGGGVGEGVQRVGPGYLVIDKRHGKSGRTEKNAKERYVTGGVGEKKEEHGNVEEGLSG